MKFYVAGKWEERELIREIQKALILMGHEITCDWTYHEKDDPGYPQTYAIEDVRGSRNSDVYVGLFERRHNYKGALVEMGVSLGNNNIVCVIGHAIDLCIFISHPLVKQFENIKEFLEYIDDKRVVA